MINEGQICYEAYAAAWLEKTGYYEPAWENVDDSVQAAWEAAAAAVIELMDQ